MSSPTRVQPGDLITATFINNLLARIETLERSVESSAVTVGEHGNVGIGTQSPGEKLHISRGALVVDAVNTTRTPEVVYGPDQFWGKWIRSGPMLTNAGGQAGGGGWNLQNAFGMHVQNDSDYAFFGGQRGARNRVDAIIAWGDDPADSLRFMFGESLLERSQELMRITASGNVGIGTDTPVARLHIVGRGDASLTDNGLLVLARPAGDSVVLDSNEILARDGKQRPATLYLQTTGGQVVIGSPEISDPGTFLNVHGNIRARGTISADGDIKAQNFPKTSDARLKTAIQPLGEALERLEIIRGVSFAWRDDAGRRPGRRQLGVIAQEVEQAFPELVSEDGDGIKAVDYSGLVAVLIEAVKELKAEVAALKQQLQPAGAE